MFQMITGQTNAEIFYGGYDRAFGEIPYFEDHHLYQMILLNLIPEKIEINHYHYSTIDYPQNRLILHKYRDQEVLRFL